MPEARKHTPRSILEAFYDAERIYMSAPPDKRDFSGIAATLSPDYRLLQTPALPYGGEYIGPEGLERWAKQMADYFSIVDVKAPEIFESEGSNRVVVYSTVHFKVRATGEEVDYPFCQVVTVDLEKGVMTELMPFYWDVAQVNRMLGHTPKN
ncbi:unnamed protein product [Clonostachys chloroleuca]|uniref:SnoaL-like domain-containing protein n=1 Tax=Clonostachys chloroleuca TaxID=1926264 RepID=A0AA35Q7S8_9HYPO|nr:unnamed protein product [Clonostachys chloroleuca]